jgi:AraC-like DNA-binding protein
MTYREIFPHAALSGHVDRFWLRTGEIGAALEPVNILPDGCIDLIVRLEASPRAIVVGAMTRAVLAPAEGVPMAAVRFRPGGAAPFLGISAHELTDRVVGSDQLGWRWLEAEAFAGKSPRQIVAQLEALLLQRLIATRALDGRIVHAVAMLVRATAPSIESLAREIGWSRQEQSRAFARHVGVTPKQFARITRLQRALDTLQRRPAQPLARVALDFGYYDQAHMALDFRELAGVTAADARSHAGSIFPIRSLFGEAGRTT